MIRGPLILCPIDFSEAGCGALRFSAAIAEYFQSDLVIATVNDPLLNDAAAMTTGEEHLAHETVRELARFYDETFAGGPATTNWPRTSSAISSASAAARPIPPPARLGRPRHTTPITGSSAVPRKT